MYIRSSGKLRFLIPDGVLSIACPETGLQIVVYGGGALEIYAAHKPCHSPPDSAGEKNALHFTD